MGERLHYSMPNFLFPTAKTKPSGPTVQIENTLNKLRSQPFIPFPPTPPEIKTNTDLLVTPPSVTSLDYQYDGDDYFHYKLRLQPSISLRIETSQLASASSFASPLESTSLPRDEILQEYMYEGSFTELVRSGSIMSPSSTSPLLEDKSYVPLMRAYQFLCVDDNAINLRILTRLLKKLFPNATINSTTNPIEAASMAKRLPFDMCFLDIEMPKLSGKELAAIIRLHSSTMGLIAVTTRAGADDMLLYEEIGFDTTFPKPLRLPYSMIMDSVENIIARRNAKEV